ncbi:hypothetical protein NDU88_008743 [Pleurodeles waltl]|uniref:Uncharacterized protein n=1 Tax=Pleurodeles waltl TaxID=8319 RepID=A0AAV7PTS4_PLEWA|nr:hypothetical protein NDU88_008743 [Pleurodeles waltl]
MRLPGRTAPSMLSLIYIFGPTGTATLNAGGAVFREKSWGPPGPQKCQPSSGIAVECKAGRTVCLEETEAYWGVGRGWGRHGVNR